MSKEERYYTALSLATSFSVLIDSYDRHERYRDIHLCKDSADMELS